MSDKAKPERLEVDELTYRIERTAAESFAEALPLSAVTFTDDQTTRHRGISHSWSGGHDSEAFAALLSRLGTLPPSPSTLRGRVGRILTWIVSRANWWHTVQLRQLASVAASELQEMHSEIAELRRRIESKNHTLAAVSQDLQRMQVGLQDQDDDIRRIKNDLETLRGQQADSSGPGVSPQ